MTSKKAKNYCSVFGCLNNDSSNPDLSFFKIPTEQEKRLQWLRLIDREDLSHKSTLRTLVCEVHFKPADISVNSQRKLLKKNCSPCLHLPKNKEDKANNTPDNITTTAATQTDITTCSFSRGTHITTSENVTQTTTSLSADTPRKRKSKSDLSTLKKRQNLHDTAHNLDESQRDVFFKLCDCLSSKNLAEIVKAQVNLKLISTGSRNTLAYKIFCLNLYYVNPQAYRLLQQALCLPSKARLKRLNIPITTQVNEDLMSFLKLKVNNMSDRERQCTLIVNSMSLKKHLFYNIKKDKIIGFHEVDGVQSPSPAKHALVVFVRGIFEKWSQAVGFALLSECKSDDIFKWIDKIILKLFEVGLKIRVFVSDMGLDRAARKRGISVDKTYFTVKEHKIYYIFDAPHLIKLVRNNLMTYDFHLENGKVAKYEHIVQFYGHDKNKTFRQAYKLTNKHTVPTSFEKRQVRYATQLLSRSVATGLSTYIDFKIIDESARHTVEFITIMNDLFDVLNSSRYRHSYMYKSALCGNVDQIDFLNNTLMFFQTLKLYNPKNGSVTKSVKFIDGFQITIKSVLNLYEDLKQEGFEYLLTRRLNQEIIEKFFGKIRSRNGMATEPTSRQFISAYRKIYFANITQSPKEGNCSEDLTEFLINLKDYKNFVTGAREIDEQLNNSDDTNHTQEKENVLSEILRSDYAQLQLPEKNTFFYVCGALLKRCVDFHKNCAILKLYVDNERPCNSSPETRYIKDRNYDIDPNLLMVPPDDFLSNIERMEQVFCNEFKKDHINIKIGLSVYQRLQEVDFKMPCPCFPKSFLQKLYIRMRIYLTLTANNKAFRASRNRNIGNNFVCQIYEF